MNLRPSPESGFRRALVPSAFAVLATLTAAVPSAAPAHAVEGPLFSAPYLTFDTGGRPGHVSIADLNRDGFQDLVVPNSDRGTVSVLPGDGSGLFTTWTEHAVGAAPGFVAVADLNADGKLDLCTADRSDNTVSVLIGNGDGTFAPAATYETWLEPAWIAIGDLNGDGRLDLAVAAGGAYPDYAGKVSVLLGDGTGGFGAHTGYPAGSSPTCVAIGDLDRDGRMDLAVSNWYSNRFSTLIGSGDGSFPNRTEYPTTGLASSVVLEDFSGDGRLDLAVATYGNLNKIGIHLGNGDGSLFSGPEYEAGNRPQTLTAADVNGDGHLDLATANVFYDAVTVLLGRGDGTFGPRYEAATPYGPIALAIGELNGDGKPDLAVANALIPKTVTVLFGSGDGRFGTNNDLYMGAPPASLAIGDLDGDAAPDLAVAKLSPDSDYPFGSIAVLLGLGDGSFGPRSDHPTVTDPFRIAIGDLNGDHRQDIVFTAGSIGVMLGREDGTLGPAAYSAQGLAGFLALGDLNADGIPDLAVARNGPTPHSFGLVSTFLGRGDGTFGPNTDHITGRGPASLAIGDLNGDGRLDVVTADYGYGTGSDSVSVLLGNGDGTLGARSDYLVGRFPKSVAIGDLSGDGRPDLAVANSESDFFTVLLGNGDGTFGLRREYATPNHPEVVVVADLNHDGRFDVATGSQYANSISVRLGRSDGSLGPRVGYGTGDWPGSIAVGDLNGDGLTDVATANMNWETVSVLLNRGPEPTTATLLSRFEAVWVGERIEVRWQFGPDSRVLSTTVERSETATGPWTAVEGERRLESGVTVLVDPGVEAGHAHFYRLSAVLPGGETMTFGPISTAGEAAATGFALLSIAPSPATGPARVVFTLAHEAPVRITVLDVLGRRAALLVDETLPAGRHEAVWESGAASGRFPAGLYFVRFEWPGGSATRRLALTR